MAKVNGYVRTFLKKAHYIPTLSVVVGNMLHKWGQGGLHYVDETYLYLFRCIDWIINHNVAKKTEEIQLLKLQQEYSQLIFDEYVKVVNNCLRQKNNLIPLEKSMPIGTWEKNGVTLDILPDYSFKVEGTAVNDVVFYLVSNTKNPIGGWYSLPTPLEVGTYLFFSDFKCVKDEVIVQLVISNSSEDRRWITADYSARFKIDKPYAYQLIRLIIKKGKSVNQSGRLHLEKLHN